ncbi:type I-B CRISPR-associated protein Cas5b [Fusobacterium animalis]|uniref:type I-B CRISPR-associated protein Cas5b n=1 Tax=Fusobacterium animalis TaxID=76859 RepID=UPI0030CE6520
MKALKFTLSGDSAFFKDNVINTVYLTYGNIHRVALLGMFGAILGYGGYSKQNDMLKKKNKKKPDYPEFYEKLKDIKISIVSNGKNGYFNKKLQTFNNSVGYASKEEGGNLIVKQFWLENPSWDIYVLLDCDEAKKIADYMQNRKAIYLPYLGSNDHLANIMDVEIIDIEEKMSSEDETIEILSMIKDSDISEKKKNIFSIDKNSIRDDIYKYSEYLPVTLSKELNQYEKEKMTITNMSVILKKSYYKVEDKNIVFY